MYVLGKGLNPNANFRAYDDRTSTNPHSSPSYPFLVETATSNLDVGGDIEQTTSFPSIFGSFHAPPCGAISYRIANMAAVVTISRSAKCLPGHKLVPPPKVRKAPGRWLAPAFMNLRGSKFLTSAPHNAGSACMLAPGTWTMEPCFRRYLSSRKVSSCTQRVYTLLVFRRSVSR